MNHLTKITLLVVLFALFTGITIYVVRQPSYKIETDGKLYIVNKLSSSVTVFDLFLGKQLAEIPIDVEPHEITPLIDQDKLVLTNYGRPGVNGNGITVIDTKINEIENTINLGESLKPHGIVSSPQSDRVCVINDLSNDLLVVNVKTGSVEKKIPTLQKMSHLLALHPNKPLAYATNINSNSVSVIDLETGKVIYIIPCGLGTEGIDVTPDGSEIWVSNNHDNTIQVINTESYKTTHTLKTGEDPSRIKFSINGNQCLVTNAGDGTILVFDRQSKRQIKKITIPGKEKLFERILFHSPRPVGILMHPNGLYAFVANSNADQVIVIDMQNFSIVSTIGTGRIPDGLAFVE